MMGLLILIALVYLVIGVSWSFIASYCVHNDMTTIHKVAAALLWPIDVVICALVTALYY